MLLAPSTEVYMYILLLGSLQSPLKWILPSPTFVCMTWVGGVLTKITNCSVAELIFTLSLEGRHKTVAPAFQQPTLS